MKKSTFILMTAILLAGGAVSGLPALSHAQGYEYPPPPENSYASPWVGPDTPWVYYNGDWFLDGVLYYYYGPEYGWAPYYAYDAGYIVRSDIWYAPRWQVWYRGRPQYLERFQEQYPYWRAHHEGERYDRRFYEQHHRGQSGGWQKGFHGGPAASSRPEGTKPGRTQSSPQRQQQPAAQHEPQRQQPQPAAHHEQQRQQQQPAAQHEQQRQQQQPAAQHEQHRQQQHRQGEAKE